MLTLDSRRLQGLRSQRKRYEECVKDTRRVMVDHCIGDVTNDARMVRAFYERLNADHDHHSAHRENEKVRALNLGKAPAVPWPRAPDELGTLRICATCGIRDPRTHFERKVLDDVPDTHWSVIDRHAFQRLCDAGPAITLFTDGRAEPQAEAQVHPAELHSWYHDHDRGRAFHIVKEAVRTERVYDRAPHDWSTWRDTKVIYVCQRCGSSWGKARGQPYTDATAVARTAESAGDGDGAAAACAAAARAQRRCGPCHNDLYWQVRPRTRPSAGRRTAHLSAIRLLSGCPSRHNRERARPGYLVCAAHQGHRHRRQRAGSARHCPRALSLRLIQGAGRRPLDAWDSART